MARVGELERVLQKIGDRGGEILPIGLHDDRLVDRGRDKVNAPQPGRHRGADLDLFHDLPHWNALPVRHPQVEAYFREGAVDEGVQPHQAPVEDRARAPARGGHPFTNAGEYRFARRRSAQGLADLVEEYRQSVRAVCFGGQRPGSRGEPQSRQREDLLAMIGNEVAKHESTAHLGSRDTRHVVAIFFAIVFRWAGAGMFGSREVVIPLTSLHSPTPGVGDHRSASAEATASEDRS